MGIVGVSDGIGVLLGAVVSEGVSVAVGTSVVAGSVWVGVGGKSVGVVISGVSVIAGVSVKVGIAVLVMAGAVLVGRLGTLRTCPVLM